jgi:hypothetical protein
MNQQELCHFAFLPISGPWRSGILPDGSLRHRSP